MDCSTPGFPVLHYLLKFAQTHVRWFRDSIHPSHPFSSCPQSFSASESFPVSRLFASGGQSIGASTSASVLPMNVQGWFSVDALYHAKHCAGYRLMTSLTPGLWSEWSYPSLGLHLLHIFWGVVIDAQSSPSIMSLAVLHRNSGCLMWTFIICFPTFLSSNMLFLLNSPFQCQSHLAVPAENWKPALILVQSFSSCD